MPQRPPVDQTASYSRDRWALFTYSLSRIPPRKLPALAFYALFISYLTDHDLIDRQLWGKGGTSIVGVLSMVTGLLLSYRFSSAVQKWDEGKQIWSEIRTTIRNGIRTAMEFNSDRIGDPVNKRNPLDNEQPQVQVKNEIVFERMDELSSLLVAFAFSLQHHLLGTRPLPQPPLCDLLPSSYLSSLKRTEARVRFADTHAGPSKSFSLSTSDLGDQSSDSLEEFNISLEKKSQSEARSAGDQNDETIDISTYLSNVIRLDQVVEMPHDQELQQQLDQLNIPANTDVGSPTNFCASSQSLPTTTGYKPPKSNLHSPYPPNLPLALLKLIEAYVNGLANISDKDGGWDIPRRERGYNIIRSLNEQLGKAEILSSNPPPLPLTVHLSHLLFLYLAALPCSLLCVVRGWRLVVISLIAGWCLLGLEALIGEVSKVFGFSENHHPLPVFSQQILNESLDISPSFMRYYRRRLISRVGETANEVTALEKWERKATSDWLPNFS
nr:hypothetical protein L204_02080 [Cryptococcus depauperatus CBS 7855]